MKKDIIKELISIFEKKKKQGEEALENTRKRAREAPGSNVSHSDTSKFQHSNLQLGQQQCLADLIEGLNKLKIMFNALTEDIPDIIGVGTLVKLENTETLEVNYYLIIPKEGGDIIEHDGKKITAISIDSPLGKLLLKKEVGEEIKQNKSIFEITEIQ